MGVERHRSERLETVEEDGKRTKLWAILLSSPPQLQSKRKT